MAISFDSNWAVAGGNSGTSFQTAFHTPGVGTKLIVAGIISTQPVVSIVDGVNVYNLLPFFLTQGGNLLYWAYAVNPSISSVRQTVTLSASGACAVGAVAVIGTASSNPLDLQGPSAQGSSASLSSGNAVTTAFANEILFGIGHMDSGATCTWTAGAGYSFGAQSPGSGTNPNLCIEYQIVAATGIYAATMTNAVNAGWGAGIISFADTPIPGVGGGNGAQELLGAGAITSLPLTPASRSRHRRRFVSGWSQRDAA